MKLYTCIYNGTGNKNFRFSFEAETNTKALAFCQSKFDIPTDHMAIVENNRGDIATDVGRLVFANGAFVSSRAYLVVQRVGDHDEFVWDEDATNTAVDCPNGDGDYLTYEEAEDLVVALKANAEKKGWVNAIYIIQKV